MFLRGRLVVLKVDSVYAAESLDVKKRSTSKHTFAMCTVSENNLIDPDADFHAERQTSRGIEDLLHDIKNARGGGSGRVRSRELGVAVRGDGMNPFRPYALVNTVRQIPVDRFHQDTLVCYHRDRVFRHCNLCYLTLA